MGHRRGSNLRFSREAVDSAVTMQLG